MRSSVLFPQPDGPDHGDELAGADVERGLAQRMGAVGEDHRHPVKTQCGSSPYVAHWRNRSRNGRGVEDSRAAQCITIPPVTFIA